MKQPRPMVAFVATVLVLALGAISTREARATVSGKFFPRVPAHAKRYGMNGVLLAYGVGNDTGGLALRRNDGSRVQFYLGWPHTFQGKRVTCKQVRVPAVSPDYTECRESLPGIVLGKSRVHVTYWKQPYNGALVNVAEDISRDP